MDKYNHLIHGQMGLYVSLDLYFVQEISTMCLRHLERSSPDSHTVIRKSTPAMHYALVRGSSHQIWWPWGIARQIDPYLTPTDLYMTFDPSNALRFGQEFFPPNLVAIGHLLAFWTLVDPRWPLHDLWPQQCTTLWPGFPLTKFGSHRVFLRQIDPWVTFDPRLGRFENMPTNLGGPSPTPMPSFSSIPQSTAKRIAGHIHTQTPLF